VRKAYQGISTVSGFISSLIYFPVWSILACHDILISLFQFLNQICFEGELESDERNFCFWLFLNIAKYHSVEETLATANTYLKIFPDGYDDEALIGVKESIENGNLWPVG
jgi:hypothetical protein